MKVSLFFNAIICIFAPLFVFSFSSCASGGAARAEEYFSIGMAYFEMGNFAEAEKWLNRAGAADKTMLASEYNLGRIAFETGRYEEAALYFEKILTRDAENVMALQAAAYSRIKNGDFEKAESLYIRVLALVPESADDGFNYALVLYGIEKYGECEEVLNKYPLALEKNPAPLLLLARAQNARDKIEAVDSYARWAALAEEPGAAELYEYARALEKAGLYARAFEQFDKALTALADDSGELKKSFLRFEKARVLLFADPENKTGMEELNTAVTEGFSDVEAVKSLLLDERIKKENRDEIREILNNLITDSEKAEETEETSESEHQVEGSSDTTQEGENTGI